MAPGCFLLLVQVDLFFMFRMFFLHVLPFFFPHFLSFFSFFLFYAFDPFLFLLLQLFKPRVDKLLCFLLRMIQASLEMAVVITSTWQLIYFLYNSNTIYIPKSVLSQFKVGLVGNLVFCAKVSTFLFLQVLIY